MATNKEVFERALTLAPSEKAELINELIASLDMPDALLDELWAVEAESRIKACDDGKLREKSLSDVLRKYR